MNITPITKKYTNPYRTSFVSFGKNGGDNKNAENNFSCTKTIVKNTPKATSNSYGTDFSNIHFLADMPLCDAYEVSEKKNVAEKLPVTFGSSFPQFLADQDTVAEQYEVTSNSVNNIANSMQYSFGSARREEVSFTSRLLNIIKRVLPL